MDLNVIQSCFFQIENAIAIPILAYLETWSVFIKGFYHIFFSQLGSCIHSGNKINIVTRNPILTMSLAHNCQYAVFNPDVMIHYRE